MSNLQHWCSLHGGWHDEPTRQGYCRPCRNAYNRWKYLRDKFDLPVNIGLYREETNQPLQRRPREQGPECKACLKRPREQGVFCRGCHSAYLQWSRRRRDRASLTNTPPRVSIADFCQAVDNGSVVPRHEGEAHQGRVVRSI